MSLTRKYLQGMGLTEEQVDAIIESNEETIKGLKSEIARYKADAEGKEEIQKELDELKAKQSDDDPSELAKVQKQLSDKTAEFDKFKAEVEAKETKAKKETAYRKLLKEAGISDKRIDIVVKASPSEIEAIAFDKDGNVKDADKITAGVKDTWAEFVVKQGEKGADVSNPPAGNGGNPDNHPSRAAELFKQHTESMYGNKSKEE
jgi:UDP-glucose 6-dehydrogenase